MKGRGRISIEVNMILRFIFGQYDEICDKYEKLFEFAEPLDTEEQNGNVLVVRNRRIVFPQLHVSFREGDWYARNQEIIDPDDDDAWEVQDSVYVLYEENEKDINKYKSFMTGSLDYFLAEICKNTRDSFEKDLDELECYIDTSEFIAEETAQQLVEEV